MSAKKSKKNVVVDTSDMLAGIQALTVFYEQKVQDYAEVKEQLGEGHPAIAQVFEELTTLGDILNHFSNLVSDQLKGDENGNLN